MNTYQCSCGAEIYFAVRDVDASDLLKVDVQPVPHGDIALAQRWVGPGAGTMFTEDHVIIWRRIPHGEIYNGTRRQEHVCAQPRPLPDNCRSCAAPIYWAITTDGKRMPVDAEPVLGGNIDLDFNLPISAHVVPKGSQHKASLYTSHFVTCPNATTHRRKR